VDFYQIKERSKKQGEITVTEIYPDFKVGRSKDLMLRGRAFYAIWDEAKGLWSTDEYDASRLVDEDLMQHKKEIESRHGGSVQVKRMSDFSSGSWRQFRNFMALLSDSSHQLDSHLTFSNTEVKKTDYVSRRLPYPLSEGDISAYQELFGTLYEPDELAKLEWAIGAIVAGDARYIQKFIVLYGGAGLGKSTWLNLTQALFSGYYSTFEAKALTSMNNTFSMEVFRTNPLVAIQHDGDLSNIQDNSKLNSIISHEDMTMNEKFKASFTTRINAFLLMGTNKPVKITDAKSGIIRRLLDVQPSGNRVAPRRYQALVSQLDFELGAIAFHCLTKYREMGKTHYDDYKAIEMMLQTDVFFNFIEDIYDTLKDNDGITLHQAHEMYKVFCDQSLIEFKLPRYKFREELKNYFHKFEERAVVDGIRVRSWYSEFRRDRFKVKITEEPRFTLVMDDEESIFDSIYEDSPSQYATSNETPYKKWAEVTTKLSDIDTSRLHYVKTPVNDIVIDFDIKDADGNKSAELNLEAASKWPSTYGEFSKSGAGVHLHYHYDGDASDLAGVYAEGVEIKSFVGFSSLRRKLSKCNNVPIAIISSGLPLKEKKVINVDTIKSEKSLRELIDRNLRKEIHQGTKPSMDFIHKILEEAYSSGLSYDVSDLRNRIMAFANNSTNQAMYCIKLVQNMKFKSEEAEIAERDAPKDDRNVFFDCEVFPNLFMISWKYEGSDNVVRMVNPPPNEVEELLNMKLIGYNCRRYDNHILYARVMGYDNEQLYKLSQKIIKNTPSAMFGEAYDLSYADIYDFSSIKQSLKKWEIELGIAHKELGLPWDEPVPKELWEKVGEYCDNDVVATEATWNDRKDDFVARQILAELSGLPINATTQKHTAQIIFGGDRDAQKKFVYTDLSEQFEGYVFEGGKSTYRGEETGEGGLVRAKPGMYSNVAVLDVASMHPTSLIEMNAFGPYTDKFNELLKARLAIKHDDYAAAKLMLDGRLSKYLTDEDNAEALSYALKIVVNIVYGLTSAKFDNPFRDARNVDNIVAKRGALFMVDVMKFVESKGFTVAHVKTDDIKIVDATPEIIDEVMEFGLQYGYTFEHKSTYSKFCLVNDAVFIAKVEAGREPAHWFAIGAQFSQPYVFKYLFSRELIVFRDLCEAKYVTTALYLDFTDVDEAMALAENKMQFVGKAGLFTPIKPDCGGGLLMREKDGNFGAAAGSKGYRWMESEMVLTLNKENDIDMGYFENLVDNAVANISKHGDYEWLVS